MERITLVTKKDLEITWFSGGGGGGGGGGGQHKNRHNNCARIYHSLSGARAQSTEHKEAPSNLKAAFLALCNTSEMKSWIKKRQAEIATGQNGEERVENWMRPQHLKVEYLTDGQWVPEEVA